MHIFKVSFIASVAGAMALQLHAQPASPELQNKALELLRQTMAQPQPPPNQQAPITAQPAPTVSPQPAPTPSPQPAPTVSPQPATTPSAIPAAVPAGRASPDQQQQALQLLREKMAEQAASPKPSATNVASAKAKPAKSSKTKAAPAKSATTTVQSTGTNRPPEIATPAAPEQPAGPKTKQQRLMDLLELYKADKITPAEYHAQRAKILAEP